MLVGWKKWSYSSTSNTPKSQLSHCILITADGPQRARSPIPPTATLPSCLWSRRLFPTLPGSLSPSGFWSSSALLQLVNQWSNFTYSRPHAFRYGRQKKNPFLTRTEFTRSAIIGGARGYLLHHLGYEGTSNHTAAGPRFPPKCDIILYFSSMNCFYAVPGIIVQWVSPVTKIGLLWTSRCIMSCIECPKV